MKEHLIKRREELGYSQEEIAELAGISPRTVNRWERGNVTPSIEKARSLADALQTTVQFVISGEDGESVPDRNDIEQLRFQSKMNRKAFANYFDIPYRTVEEWEKGRRTPPDYLVRLMEYKLVNEGLIPGTE